MVIEIKNLKKKFKNFILFKDLNLKIESGLITCIYGASGCGKTTLLDIIGQIQDFDAGEVLYDGKTIRGKREKIKFLREKVGFVFQDYGLIENEIVKQNLQLMYCVKKNKNLLNDINPILKKLNLDEGFLNRKIYGMSGGEQQRITIAKILLKNPDIILADEPTASLDEENKKIVLNFFKDYSKQGKTIIIVSHEKDIAKFSDVCINLEELKNNS